MFLPVFGDHLGTLIRQWVSFWGSRGVFRVLGTWKIGKEAKIMETLLKQVFLKKVR